MHIHFVYNVKSPVRGRGIAVRYSSCGYSVCNKFANSQVVNSVDQHDINVEKKQVMIHCKPRNNNNNKKYNKKRTKQNKTKKTSTGARRSDAHPSAVRWGDDVTKSC